MPKTMKECELIGRVLEDAVAERLRDLGLTVYQNLYVPYYPGCPNTTQIDILAFTDNSVVTVECKNYCGAISCDQNSGKWSWRCGDYAGGMHDPHKQGATHARALKRWFGCDVVSAVVIADHTTYTGPDGKGIYHLSELDRMVSELRPTLALRPAVLSAFQVYCSEWANPSLEVKRDHVLHVNDNRNKKDMQALKRHESVYRYCVCVDSPIQPYYYFYTDENGNHWGTEFFEKVTLFETLEEAQDIAFEINGAAVYSLEFGFVDIVEEPDEFEGMTREEYAYAIGARPW